MEAFSSENVAVCIGHRWSAGFPSLNADLNHILDHDGFQVQGGGRSFVSKAAHFAACGDYLVPKNIQGRIEGAALSGIAAADGILATL